MSAPVEPAAVRHRQLVLALPDGDDDRATAAQAAALDGKRRSPPLPSELVTVHRPARAAGEGPGTAELRRALAGRGRVATAVDARSRLYLVGVGRPDECTVSGWSPADLARLLADAGLREVELISLVADGAGRDPARADDDQADPRSASFAAELHRVLRRAHGVHTSVKARVGRVRVLTRDEVVDGAPLAAGRKLTAPLPPAPGGERHHAPRSKLRWFWDGEDPRCEWSG